MIGDLPELDDFFADTTLSSNGKHHKKDLPDAQFGEQLISIFISKEPDKWLPAEFIDVAVAGIGIHVRLPIIIELTSTELNNVKIRFIKKNDDMEEILKESQVLVRWQEQDEISGYLKLGLHFHGDLKNDLVLVEILKKFKALKK